MSGKKEMSWFWPAVIWGFILLGATAYFFSK